MALKTYHCPECETVVPLDSARRFQTFTNYTCPNCGVILADEELVERLAYAILKWGGGVGLNRDEILQIAYEIIRAGRQNTVQRFYNFDQEPITKRDTFSDSNILAKAPAVTLWTDGLVAQDNKLYEIAPETFFNDDHSGGVPSMASSARGDMNHCIRAVVGAFSSGVNRLNLHPTEAFVSLGFGSWDTAVPPTGDGPVGTTCGFFEVRRSLRDPLNFWCVGRNGQTGKYFSSPIVTLPDLGTILYGIDDHLHKTGGDIVEIFFNPGNPSALISAYARGRHLHTVTSRDYYPQNYASVSAYPAPIVRIALFSGPQTNPCAIGTQVSGLMVEDVFSDSIPGGWT